MSQGGFSGDLSSAVEQESPGDGPNDKTNYFERILIGATDALAR